ncbi:MAG: LytTR family transcriptional regulator DNA-binding domain-containing protein [Sphingobacteriaceae bacterium]|nr:LytTR family transcriptional regulator DNA-binding domain-containing protein [Sphingobacteriaceae bacterium]
MMKTLIIDDESLARDIIKHYLKDFDDIEIVAECCDGFEGLKAINLYQPDFIFLDIQMPKINGFEMLELLEKVPNVIFTTAFDAFAIKAFEVNAVDYLLKPIEKERFSIAIRKLREKMQNNHSFDSNLLESISLSSSKHNNRVVVKKEGLIKIIPAEDVHYFEANDDYVKINTANDSYTKNKTMAFFEQSLDSEMFVRIHRSYIVNINQVTKIELKGKDSYFVLLKSSIWLPISKTGYQKLKIALGI